MENLFRKKGITEGGCKVKRISKVLAKEGIWVRGHRGCVWILDTKGKYLISAGDGKKVFIWSLKKKKLKVVIRFSAVVLSVKFNITENEIFILLNDESVFLHSIKTHLSTLITKFPSVSGMKNFTLNYSKERFLSAGDSNQMFCFDTKTNSQEEFEILDSVYCKAFTTSQLSNYIFFSISKEIIFFNIDTKKIVFKLTGHSKGVTSLALSKDEKILISASHDSTIIVWDLETQQQKFQTSPLGFTVTCAILTNSQKFYVSADKSIKIWELCSNILTDQLYSGRDPILSLCITENDKILVSGSLDQTIILWDFDEKVKISELKNHSTKIKKYQFYNEFAAFVSLDLNNLLVFWDLTTKKHIKQIQSDTHIRTVVKVSKDYLAILKGNGEIEILDLKSLSIFEYLRPNIKYLQLIKPFDSTVWILCELNLVHLWETSKDAKISQKSSLTEINSLALSDDKRFLVLSKHNEKCEVWFFTSLLNTL